MSTKQVTTATPASKTATTVKAPRAPRTPKEPKAPKVMGESALMEQSAAPDAPPISSEQREGERLAAIQQQKDDQAATAERIATNATNASNNAMSFGVQQLSTPVAAMQPQATMPSDQQGPQQPAEQPPTNMDEFAKKLAELQAQYSIAPEQVALLTGVATPKPVKANKVQQNGVTRPGPTTKCGLIWAAADQISKEIHGVCPMALLKDHPNCKTPGLSFHTVKTQYARWKAYNSIRGRLPTIQQVHEEKEPFNSTNTFGCYAPF